jgi:hypothetical protein
MSLGRPPGRNSVLVEPPFAGGSASLAALFNRTDARLSGRPLMITSV